VFGIPDDEFGEALAAHVEPHDETQLTADDVRAHVRTHLAGYKTPRVVEFSDALPREDSGKIFKRRLREPYWSGRERAIYRAGGIGFDPSWLHFRTLVEPPGVLFGSITGVRGCAASRVSCAPSARAAPPVDARTADGVGDVSPEVRGGDGRLPCARRSRSER
jgi:hypothetical protein